MLMKVTTLCLCSDIEEEKTYEDIYFWGYVRENGKENMKNWGKSTREKKFIIFEKFKGCLGNVKIISKVDKLFEVMLENFLILVLIFSEVNCFFRILKIKSSPSIFLQSSSLIF